LLRQSNACGRQGHEDFRRRFCQVAPGLGKLGWVCANNARAECLAGVPGRPSNRFLIKPRWHRIELPAVGVVALRRKAVARCGRRLRLTNGQRASAASLAFFVAVRGS